LTRVWDRIAHSVDPSAVRAINAELATLKRAAKTEDVAKAADGANRLRNALVGVMQSRS
jgi:hypothetical protein